MKKPSRRAKRMMRNHNRRKQTRSLMLVSLMDIFTILVFFLLVNTSTDTDPFPDLPYLPLSTSQQPGEQTIQIIADENTILVNNNVVIADISAWLQPETPAQLEAANDAPLITALVQRRVAAESAATSSASASNDAQATPDLTVTLLADKALPYSVIDKINRSASEAGFTTVSHGTRKQPVTNTQPPVSSVPAATPTTSNEASN